MNGQVYNSIQSPNGACVNSVYQALSPPLKGPGDEANGNIAMATYI